MRWWNRKISAGIDLSTVVRVVKEIPELRVTLVIAMAKAAHGVTDKEGVMGVLGAGAVTLTLRVGARKGTVAEGGSGRCRLPTWRSTQFHKLDALHIHLFLNPLSAAHKEQMSVQGVGHMFGSPLMEGSNFSPVDPTRRRAPKAAPQAKKVKAAKVAADRKPFEDLSNSNVALATRSPMVMKSSPLAASPKAVANAPHDAEPAAPWSGSSTWSREGPDADIDDEVVKQQLSSMRKRSTRGSNDANDSDTLVVQARLASMRATVLDERRWRPADVTDAMWEVFERQVRSPPVLSSPSDESEVERDTEELWEFWEAGESVRKTLSLGDAPDATDETDAAPLVREHAAAPSWAAIWRSVIVATLAVLVVNQLFFAVVGAGPFEEHADPAPHDAPPMATEFAPSAPSAPSAVLQLPPPLADGTPRWCIKLQLTLTSLCSSIVRIPQTLRLGALQAFARHLGRALSGVSRDLQAHVLPVMRNFARDFSPVVPM